MADIPTSWKVCLAAVSLLLGLTYLAELTAGGALIYYLYIDSNLTWFYIILIIMVLPTIMIQVVSWRLDFAPSKSWIWDVMKIASHLLLMSVPLRYLRLICAIPGSKKDYVKEFTDISILRVAHTLLISVPILGIQVYFLLLNNDTFTDFHLVNKIELSCAILTFLSTILSFTSLRFAERLIHCQYMRITSVCPDVAVTIFWRICETIARVLPLVLFATLYGYWSIFVVILHWITMIIWIIASNVSTSNKLPTTRTTLKNIATAYVLTYFYVNKNNRKGQFSVVVYYLILCLENVILLSLWSIYDNKLAHLHLGTIILILVAFAFTVMCALVNKMCLNSSNKQSTVHQVKEDDGCINCKLSCCVKHGVNNQRPWTPGSMGWSSDSLMSSQSGSMSLDSFSTRASNKRHFAGIRPGIQPSHLMYITDKQLPGDSFDDPNKTDFLWDNYDLEEGQYANPPDIVNPDFQTPEEHSSSSKDGVTEKPKYENLPDSRKKQRRLMSPPLYKMAGVPNHVAGGRRAMPVIHEYQVDSDSSTITCSTQSWSSDRYTVAMGVKSSALRKKMRNRYPYPIRGDTSDTTLGSTTDSSTYCRQHYSNRNPMLAVRPGRRSPSSGSWTDTSRTSTFTNSSVTGGGGYKPSDILINYGSIYDPTIHGTDV